MAEGKSIGSLLIKIAADTAQLRAGIKQSQSEIKSFEKNLSSLKTAFVGAFSVAAITAFGKQSFQAYQQQLMQERQLLTALNGRTDIQERLIRQANYLQNTTLFEDDQIIGQQKMLAALGLSERQIRDVIKASTQLATALNVDLGTAVKNLTGTYSGNLRELGKYIPELKNLTKEQLAAGEAVKWVNENMKGLAETAADTDPITQMKKAWGELSESFGKVVAPSVTGVAKGLTMVLRSIGSEHLTFWQKLAGVMNINTAIMNNAVVEAADEFQQSQDDIAASTEKTTKSIEKQTAAIKKLSEAEIQASLKSMSAGPKLGWQDTEVSGKSSMGYQPKSIGPSSIDNILPGTDVGGSKLQAQWQANYDSILEYYEKIKAATADMTRIVQDSFTNLAVGFGESIGNMVATGQKMDFSFVIRTFGELASSLGKMMIGMGTAGIALKKLSMNPYLAVAAGVALVALGAAASSAANNIVSGGGGGNTSMPSSAQSGGNDYFSRQMYGGYQTLKIEVTGTIKNDVIAISNARGVNKMDRY